DQQVRIMRPLRVNLIVGDDLVLGLLQLHHLAELIRLAGLALADDLSRRFEQTEQLTFAPRVAAEDSSPGLLHDLPDARDHQIKLLAQTIQRNLLQERLHSLHSPTDLLGESSCLADYAARRVQQTRIALLQFVLIERTLGTRHPPDLQESQLHTSAAIAQLRSDCTRNLRDLAHGARQHADAVSQQGAVGRIMDIRLHHRRIDTHSTTGSHAFLLGYLHQPRVNLLEHLGSDRDAPAPDCLGVRHLGAAHAGEVAVHQIGADLALEHFIAPVADMLQDQ